MRLITDQELGNMSTENKRRRHTELDKKVAVAAERGWSCMHRIEAVSYTHLTLPTNREE